MYPPAFVFVLNYESGAEGLSDGARAWSPPDGARRLELLMCLIMSFFIVALE